MPQAPAAAASAEKPSPDDAPPTIIPTQTLSRLLPATDYDVHCMTLISSSKIHRKVTRMLEHLGHHTAPASADSTAAAGEQEESGAEDTAMPDATANKSPDTTTTTTTAALPGPNPLKRKRGPKPRVVTLSAKAPAASKAISVAEIVKRTIAAAPAALAGELSARKNGSADKEEEDASARKKRTTQRGAAPALYQYNVLTSMPPAPLPRSSSKATAVRPDPTIETHASAATEPLNRKRKRQPENEDKSAALPKPISHPHEEEEEPTPAPTAPHTQLEPGQAQDSDSDAYFETAQHKPNRHHQDPLEEELQPQKQRHNVPILTVVFSRCRVEALRSAYGEQMVYVDDGDGGEDG